MENSSHQLAPKDRLLIWLLPILLSGFSIIAIILELPLFIIGPILILFTLTTGFWLSHLHKQALSRQNERWQKELKNQLAKIPETPVIGLENVCHQAFPIWIKQIETCSDTLMMELESIANTFAFHRRSTNTG